MSIEFGVARIYVYYIALYGIVPFLFPSLESSMQAINQIVDLSVCFLVASIFMARLSTKSKIRLSFRDPDFIFVVFLVFGLWFLILSVLFKTNLYSVLSYFFVSFRTLIFMYLVYLISLRVSNFKNVCRLIQIDFLVLVTLHSFVACLQLGDIDLGLQLVPQINEFQSSTRSLALGEAVGMFPNSADFGYLGLSVLLASLAYRKYQILSYFSTLTIAFCIFMVATAGSITVIILSVICFLFLFKSRFLKIITFVLLFLVSTMLLLLYYKSVAAAFGLKIDNMFLSRLGILFVSYPGLLATDLMSGIVGLTPDFEHIYRSLPSVPVAITADNALRYFNDVYILAILLSYGLVGGYLYFYMYVSLFYLLVPSKRLKDFKYLHQAVFLVVLLGSFFNQVLILKSFGIIFAYGLLPLALHARVGKSQGVVLS
jgi:hypothetical protein